MKTLFRFAGSSPTAAAGMLFLLAVVAAALLAPQIAPYDPDAQDLSAAREAPSSRHFLGTDFQGSDILSKIIYGTRPTLLIAVGVSAATLAIGFFLGTLSAWMGGIVDSAVMRTVDIMLAFPALLLNIILVAVLGAGMGSLFLALTLTGWAGVARISRGLVLGVSSSPYVESARALGARPARIIAAHVVPNCASTLIVVFAMRTGSTILAAAGLNYLGLGAPAETNSWGVMVSLAQYDIVTAWWWPLAPATAIALTVLSVNLIADAARDMLDPETRGRLGAARPA